MTLSATPRSSPTAQETGASPNRSTAILAFSAGKFDLTFP
jgi:hypothetical protein